MLRNLLSRFFGGSTRTGGTRRSGGTGTSGGIGARIGSSIERMIRGRR